MAMPTEKPTERPGLPKKTPRVILLDVNYCLATPSSHTATMGSLFRKDGR